MEFLPQNTNQRARDYNNPLARPSGLALLDTGRYVSRDWLFHFSTPSWLQFLDRLPLFLVTGGAFLLMAIA
jgi:hypothetical protein